MIGKTETRMREIRSRTRQYQKRYEARLLSCLTMCSLFLLAGIGVLFRSVQTPGIVSVAEGYGAVLLRDGTGRMSSLVTHSRSVKSMISRMEFGCRMSPQACNST